MSFSAPQLVHKLVHTDGTHLCRRGGVYYYRRRLPGPTSGEIGLSLRTRKFLEAEYLSEALDRRFATAYRPNMTPRDLTPILREHLQDLVRWGEQQLEARGLQTAAAGDPAEDPLDLELDTLDRAISDAQEAVARRDYRSVKDTARRMMESHALPEEQFAALASGLLRVRHEALETFRRSLLGEYPPIGVTPAVTEVASAPTEKAGPLLSEALEALFAAMRNKPQPWEPNTIRKAETTFRLFLEFTGDKPVNEYKRSDCHAFYRALAQLPKTYGKSPKDRGRTMREMIEAAKGLEVPRLASKSIKGHSSPLGALFEHYKDPDRDNWSNPAYGFDFEKVGAASVPREMWEGEPLRTLFKAPVWTGCKSEGRRKERGDLIIQDHRYWLPILALYHGARLEELARLIRGEVQEERGVPFLWITDTDEAAGGAEVVRKGRVKTDAAKRRVPLHREVLRLGFLEYVEAAAPAPGDLLFPMLKPDPKNDNLRSGKFSQWFTAYRRAAGITREDLVFHSFRHGVATKLSNASIPDSTIIELIGHEGTTTLQTHYIKRGRIPLPTLVDAINRVQWPEVELEKPPLRLGRLEE